MLKKRHSSISLLMMILITCITQVFTLMKSSMVAEQFGTTMEMDAYNFANSVVSFIFGFVSSAISTVIIPSYVKKTYKKETDTFLTAVYGVLALVILLALLLRFQLVGLFTNKQEMYVNIACNVLVILLLTNLLYSVTNVTAAYFQCIGKYNIPKILNLLFQIIVVFSLLFFKNITIIQYAVIISAGLTVNVLIDVAIAVKDGWRYRPQLDFKSQKTKELFRLFLPIILSTGIYKLSLMIDSVIASRLEIGQLSVLGYSTQIANMVNSVLIGNMLIYCYPKIVKRIQEGKSQKLFWEQAVFFHLVVCFVISGFATVGHEGIAMLFEHGKFNSSATDAVFYCALIYICGQLINIVRDLTYRFFYAVGDTATPASNSVLVSVINIVTSLILVQFIGLYGIVLGTVIASFSSLLRIIWKFNKKIGFDVSKRKLVLSFGENLLITVITIAIVYLTRLFIPSGSILVALLLFGTETAVIFLLLTFFIKRDIISVIKSI